MGLASSPVGRPLVAGLAIRQVDEALAGRLELEALEVLPRGGVELRGLRVFDPDDHLVLQVTAARLFADLTRLSTQEVGVVLELDGPSVLLESEADGGVSLARAFAPSHPSPPAPARPGQAPARPSWTLRLTRLIVRGGDLWWQRADGTTGAELTDLTLDAEGAYGPAGGFLGLTTTARVSSPAEGPLDLAVAAHLRGDQLEVPVLRGSLGPTGLAALGRGDLAAGSFRAALTRLGVGAAEVGQVAPQARLGGDLTATGYAESDGARATAALDVRAAGQGGPADGGAAGGTARAAAAVQLRPPARAVGFDVALDALDPSRLLAQAPPGRITLTARGGVAGPAAGLDLAALRGRVDLRLAPSRLRGGEAGPVALTASADRGLVELTRLDGHLPGLKVGGSGRWRDGGNLGGGLTAEVDDLGRLLRNLTALTGQPLPALLGRGRAQLVLAGTAAAPEARATLEVPSLAAGALRAELLTVSAEAAGPLATPRARLTAAAARLASGSTEARALQLTAGLDRGEAALSLSAVVPDLGRAPLSAQALARLAKDRRSAEVAELSLSWPGARWSLTRPATATFSPGSVDRLELSDGPRRLAVSGGLGPKDALDARLEVVRLDLTRLPRGLLPPELGLKGELSLDARATGTTRHPSVAAHLALAEGELKGLDGLQLLGDVGWDGKASRLTADLGLVRAAGGTLDLAADLPLPLARAAGREHLALSLGAAGWPLPVLRALAGVEAPLGGTAGAHLVVEGTVGAPTARAAMTLADASLDDLGPFALASALELSGDAAQLTAEAHLDGAPLLGLDGRVPLDLAGLLQHPEAAARGLPRAPLTGAVRLPALDLRRLAGRAGLPEWLAGTLTGSAALGGTPSAPRGEATLAVVGAALAGVRELTGRLELTAEPERTTARLRATAGGAEALRLDGTLGAPPERLADPAVLQAAPLALEGGVPDLPLARLAGQGLPLGGTLNVKVAVKGSLSRPEGRLDAAGDQLTVDGRPLGALAAVVRYQEATGTAEVSLRPATGGVLWAGGTLGARLGLGADAAALRQAPATLRVTSEKLDLGFLPALAPGLVRVASGPLTVDLSASGPVEGLRPRGTVLLTGGRLAVAELGDWSDLALAASLGDRTIEVTRLEARRAQGTLRGQLALRELGTPKAALEGGLTFKTFTLARAGMDLVTLDLPLELTGTLTDDRLDATVTVAAGTVRLPKKSPRALQPLDVREDITVGRPRPKRASWLGGAAAPAGGQAPRPFEARCRVLMPGRLFVKGESPAIDLEVKGDTTWRVVDGDLTAEGAVDVVRGTVEPISGRVFHVERGRVTFTGGGWQAGLLDVAARYDNPTAEVTVTIGGTVPRPNIQLSSRPPMDDASIAMLIATGRTEIKAGTSEVSSLTGKEAGNAALGAAAGLAFKSLVADKLPVDQVSLDASTLRAGKYLTDKLFVGYTRRFEAKPEKGENANEVKAEYQITPRWNFELRYGDAQTGDASLIWSKDY